MEEGLTSVAASITVDPTVFGEQSPPHGTTTVGSPENHPIPSDEDPDHALEPEPEAEAEPEPEQHGSKVLTEDLKQKILKQVEYYFSDENLPTDKHMIRLLKRNREGFVPIGVIASFKKMKKLTCNHTFIVSALQESSFLVVSADGRKVKRFRPFQVPEVKDPKFYTVLVENLPEDHSVENIQRIFGEIGNIKHIRICDPNAVGDSKGGKAEKFFSGKLHALVEYETKEAAEKAAATLNNEQDWRNGIRVKLLKNMGKYVQRKPVWKGPDSEKSSAGRSSDQMREEEKQNSNEHHEDTLEEAAGDNLAKEKNERRGRNHGRTAKQKYRGMSGQGHGTIKTTHGLESSKPPPGPTMPDGTRGFTMGRGRPPVLNES